MDENDAYTLCDLTGDKLMERVRGLWKPESPAESLTDITYKGFIVRADGSVDVYLTIKVNNTEAGPYSRLVIYNNSAGELKYAFDGDGIIPAQEEDTMKPKLTHGRKDR